MRKRAILMLCGLLLAFVELGRSSALAQELPQMLPSSSPPASLPAAPPHGMASAQPAAEGGADPELPPWAQTPTTAAGDESTWRRLLHWCAGEFDCEPAPAHVWFKTDYLFAWIRSDRTPVLLTTGLTTDTSPGALGLPFTKVVYGGDINYEDRAGLRLTLGYNLSETLSIDGNYFFLDGRKPTVFVNSPGTPVVARPFFNVNSGMQDSSLTTYPGLLSGAARIESYSFLEGSEVNARAELCGNDTCHVRALAGMRWLNLREGLSITESSTVTMAGPLNGLPIGDVDQFRTRNDFFGGQLGVETDFEVMHFKVDLFAKCALGDTMQYARIQGGTDLFGTFVPGGLFAVGSNIGQYSRDRFGVVPEGGLRIERAIGRHVSLNVGYSFTYMNDVVRPGNMVDTAVNVNLVPASTTFGAGANPARPAFHFESDAFWVHMFQAGLTFHW